MQPITPESVEVLLDGLRSVYGINEGAQEELSAWVHSPDESKTAAERFMYDLLCQIDKEAGQAMDQFFLRTQGTVGFKG
jgi:hypothetical protein